MQTANVAVWSSCIFMVRSSFRENEPGKRVKESGTSSEVNCCCCLECWTRMGKICALIKNCNEKWKCFPLRRALLWWDFLWRRREIYEKLMREIIPRNVSCNGFNLWLHVFFENTFPSVIREIKNIKSFCYLRIPLSQFSRQKTICWPCLKSALLYILARALHGVDVYVFGMVEKTCWTNKPTDCFY